MSTDNVAKENEDFIYWTTIPVLVNHLNYGNHLGYDSYLSIIQEARMRWLKQFGMGEKTLHFNVGYFITKATVDYKSEAFYADELRVGLAIKNIKSKAFDMEYIIINNTRNDAVCATAKTSHLCFDFETKKVVNIPESFSRVLSNTSSEQPSAAAEIESLRSRL